MNLTTKKIIFLVLILLALEIPILLSWMYIGSKDTPAQDKVAMQESVTEATAVTAEAETQASAPAETVRPETAPTETAPAETEPEETLPAETAPAKIIIEEVPHFFQNDYPEDRYGTSTIAKSGSGMTALAMVASFMTDHYYYPDEIADDLAHFIGNHYERLQYGSDLLQLSWKRAKDIREVLQSVKDGKVAIILMNEKSIFPSDHHYIVLTGVNEAGKITMLDPNKDHYSRQGIDAYLKDGIDEGLLFSGFEGGWIYDKSAMPEDPFIYEPEPYAKLCRYPGVELTEAELDLMADLIYMEGASESFEGQQAIAEVILNRLVSGDFQSSIYGIIHAVDQFQSVPYLYKAKPTYTQYKAIERAMYGPYVLPIDVVFYAKFSVNDNVWGKIGSHIFCYAY